jgi:hypothetical protein
MEPLMQALHREHWALRFFLWSDLPAPSTVRKILGQASGIQKVTVGMDIPYCGTLLAPPALPQAQDGVLDLGSDPIASAGAVQVEVPSYPKRNPGDRIIVSFKPRGEAQAVPASAALHRYRFLANPGADPAGKTYPVLVEPLWALPADVYEVGYMVTSRTGNTSVSQGATVSVRNTPQPPAGGDAFAVGQASMFGTYLPDVVQSWVVQLPGTLADANGILWQSLGKSTPGAVLGIYRTEPAGAAPQRLVTLTADADGTAWSVSPEHDALPVQFARADLVQVKLEATGPQEILLALAL